MSNQNSVFVPRLSRLTSLCKEINAWHVKRIWTMYVQSIHTEKARSERGSLIKTAQMEVRQYISPVCAHSFLCVNEGMEGGKTFPLECPLSLDYEWLLSVRERDDQPRPATELIT